MDKLYCPLCNNKIEINQKVCECSFCGLKIDLEEIEIFGFQCMNCLNYLEKKKDSLIPNYCSICDKTYSLHFLYNKKRLELESI